jgi:hypothetical protein
LNSVITPSWLTVMIGSSDEWRMALLSTSSSSARFPCFAPLRRNHYTPTSINFIPHLSFYPYHHSKLPPSKF